MLKDNFQVKNKKLNKSKPKRSTDLKYIHFVKGSTFKSVTKQESSAVKQIYYGENN